MAERAKNADSFVDKMGTILHLDYFETVYYKEYETIIKPRLLELGLRHVRNGACKNAGFTAYFDRVNELGQAGVKFNFVVPPSFDLSQLATFTSKVSDGIESFEGPNEWDLNGGSTWANDLRTRQQAMYKLIKGNSSLAKFPVIGPSVVWEHGELGDISAYLDYGNMHNYQGGEHPGSTAYHSIEHYAAKASINSGSKPIIATEMGYHNAKNATKGKYTPEAVAGKYMPRAFLEHFNRGIPRAYCYELIDSGTDLSNRNHNWGLLRNDGSLKPAFVALKNLIGLLKDPGSTFSPGSLDYTLSGSTTDVHKTLLQKRDGRFYLILWVEKSCYNPDTQALNTVPSQQVTLSLNTLISKAVTFLPNTSISGTIQTISTAVPQKLVLNVPDHPLVVELTPAPVTTTFTTSGTGLKGEYYDNKDFTNLKLTRTDATVNFDWASGSPASSIGADSFSVRWTGQVQPRYSQTYTFYTLSNDGVRLWVNGKLLIDNWTEHALTENSGTIALTSGQKYSIKMEFYESSGTAVAKLLWSSPTQAKEIIPQSRLYS